VATGRVFGGGNRYEVWGDSAKPKGTKGRGREKRGERAHGWWEGIRERGFIPLCGKI